MSNKPCDVLLTNGSYYGTVAAARFFGRLGHRVVVADSDSRHVTRFSRYFSEGIDYPEKGDFRRRMEALLDYGKAHPGTLLYPCSDDHAWIMAMHRDELSEHFLTYQPSFEVLENLLNKELLYRTCEQLKVPVPETYYPRNENHLEALADQLVGRRALIKPKTQVGIRVTKKAVVTDGGSGIVGEYCSFRERFSYYKAVSEHSKALNWPMLQEFHPDASTSTISIAGFRSRDGDVFHALASRKALQYPLKIGVGLVFESLGDQPELFDRVRRICEDVGYFGVFEAEFIQTPGEHLLMDFNPRFYGQMALEIARGLPLPGMVAEAAQGRALKPVSLSPGPHLLRHGSLLKLISTTQFLGGRIAWSQRRDWLSLGRSSEVTCVDHIYDPEDRGPWIADILKRIYKYLRHPRSSFLTLFGNA